MARMFRKETGVPAHRRGAGWHYHAGTAWCTSWKVSLNLCSPSIAEALETSVFLTPRMQSRQARTSAGHPQTPPARFCLDRNCWTPSMDCSQQPSPGSPINLHMLDPSRRPPAALPSFLLLFLPWWCSTSFQFRPIKLTTPETETPWAEKYTK